MHSCAKHIRLDITEIHRYFFSEPSKVMNSQITSLKRVKRPPLKTDLACFCSIILLQSFSLWLMWTRTLYLMSYAFRTNVIFPLVHICQKAKIALGVAAKNVNPNSLFTLAIYLWFLLRFFPFDGCERLSWVENVQVRNRLLRTRCKCKRNFKTHANQKQFATLFFSFQKYNCSW